MLLYINDMYFLIDYIVQLIMHFLVLRCHSNPCHRGDCEETNDGFKCKCPTGYTGDMCGQGNNIYKKNVTKCTTIVTVLLLCFVQILLPFGKTTVQNDTVPSFYFIVVFQLYVSTLTLANMELVRNFLMDLDVAVSQDILVNFVIKVCSPIVYFHKILIHTILFALYGIISKERESI